MCWPEVASYRIYVTGPEQMPQMLTRNKEMFEYGLSIYVVISIAYFDAVSSVDWIILQLNMISIITIGRISKKKIMLSIC